MNLKYIKNFGITYDEVQQMKQEREYTCDICGCKEGITQLKFLNVDHCHETGEVRGILCGTCNTVLGHFKDDVARLARAIEYLTV